MQRFSRETLCRCFSLNSMSQKKYKSNNNKIQSEKRMCISKHEKILIFFVCVENALNNCVPPTTRFTESTDFYFRFSSHFV